MASEDDRAGGTARRARVTLRPSAVHPPKSAERIARTAERRAALIADGKLPLVGVTAFPDKGETPLDVPPHPPVAPIERAETRIRPLVPRRFERAAP